MGHEKGKLGESQGRKAMGLPGNADDCHVAKVVLTAYFAMPICGHGFYIGTEKEVICRARFYEPRIMEFVILVIRIFEK
jgi:hypothetical protein